MTFGAIRLLIRKLQVAQGTDLEVLNGFIANRYTRILDRIPWRRLTTESIIQCNPSYITGTVDATQGSTTITGIGTAWTQAMNGMIIRVNIAADDTASSGAEYYQFTYVSATQGTLDRGYENATVAGAGYRIDQNFFLMPANCRMIKAVRPFHDRNHPLTLCSPAELSRISSQRTTYGTPQFASISWDTQSDPPIQQIELYPIPQSPDYSGVTLSWGIEYVYDPDSLSGAGSSATILPWTRPDAIIAGVAEDCAMDKGDQVRQQMYKADYNERLSELLLTDSNERPPERMRLAKQYRGDKPGSHYRRGPYHPGFTG